MSSIAQLLELTSSVAAVTDQKIDRIHGITRRSRMLALNASIEAQRVGQMGRGFAVVADEVKSVSGEIAQLTDSLRGELKGQLAVLSQHGRDLAAEVDRVRGERLADLAHNAVEIADRNLYERSCDVRWWATDPAVVDCAADSADERRAWHAGKRLGVILDSYTVYLDLWVADAQGRVIANGRPRAYPQVIGSDVSKQQWFIDAMSTRNGGEFAVADICRTPALNGAITATYATAIRKDGEADGAPIGAMGIFFDWEAQSLAIVDGVRLGSEEKSRSRCMILDRNHRIIADSARFGLLTEHFALETAGQNHGFYMDGDTLVGFALTPGYETYAGLGWYGVILQNA